MKLTLSNFAGGMNTLMDPRAIAGSIEGEPAETPDCENVEITGRGSIVCSNGFELVSSIVGTGGGKMLLSYEKNATDKYLIITHDDKHYSITPTNTAWALVGDYGTSTDYIGGTVFKGLSGIRRVILGNDLAANDTSKWDGTTFGAIATSPDGWIMEVFQGRLFIASGATLYYTDIDDEGDWAGGGTVSFPDIITCLKAEGDFLHVHTKRESFTVQMYYNDSFSLSSPLKKPYKNASGCLAHKTATSVYNDSYYLSTEGIQKLGADANYLNQPVRTNSLSWKINPSLKQSKIGMANIAKSCAIFWDKKYLCAIPYGNTTYPSRIL
jgi:hypothetical protein